MSGKNEMLEAMKVAPVICNVARSQNKEVENARDLWRARAEALGRAMRKHLNPHFRNYLCASCVYSENRETEARCNSCLRGNESPGWEFDEARFAGVHKG